MEEGIKGELRPPLRQSGQLLGEAQPEAYLAGPLFRVEGQASLSAPGEKDPRGKMRVPLLLLLALLALLATVARAEEDQETPRSRFQGLVQKAQERVATFQTTAVYQQMRELVESSIERTLKAIEQLKAQVGNLLERNPA
ncbi:hypothetical protein E2320_007237 [Naja naja]|nr:hypothetical protein E2320_007237 [Naja naja]